ncbi:hypothetical protein BGZ82_004836 [Podila clonocystis]|nr:hypothetical protein BGZ82_004836 [Podila clonocystis]
MSIRPSLPTELLEQVFCNVAQSDLAPLCPFSPILEPVASIAEQHQPQLQDFELFKSTGGQFDCDAALGITVAKTFLASCPQTLKKLSLSIPGFFADFADLPAGPSASDLERLPHPALESLTIAGEIMSLSRRLINCQFYDFLKPTIHA